MSRPARRAVRRWSWRLFRREWRQQVAVIGLISFAVAAAVLGSIAAYNLTPTRDAEFGSATHRFELSVSDSQAIPAYVEEAKQWFGDVEVIGHRQVDVAGAAAVVELRAQDPDGPFSGPMLTLLDGRLPTSASEVAITDVVADQVLADIGDQVELGGETARVVGVVENPADLADEFAVTVPSGAEPPESLTVLVQTDDGRAETFRPTSEPGQGFIEARQDEAAAAALAVMVVATLAMVLVCLVAGASFVTLAHRRLRQLGMIAAVGATRHQLRSAMVANGLAVGVVAAVLGTTSGLVVWIVAGALLESTAGHRLDRFDVPIWLLLAGAALAIATASAAAWWPAHRVARTSITDAVAARPSPPRSIHRSLIAGIVVFVAGLVAVGAGIDPSQDEIVPLLFVPGIVAVVVSVLLVGAPILRAVAKASARMPVGPRLATRDLSRFEARSSAALGAITLGLAIAVAVVLIAAANVPGADEGNLATDQLVVWTAGPGEFGGLQVPEPSPEDEGRQDTALGEIADRTGAEAVVPLDVAADPTNPAITGGRRLLNTALLGVPLDEHTTRDSGMVFVATPDLIDYLGVEPGVGGADTVLLTRQPGEVYVTGNLTIEAFGRGPVPASSVARIDIHDYSSAPRALLTEAGLAATGLEPVRAGWLLDLPGSVDSMDPGTLADLRDVAKEAGLVIETRDEQGGLTTVRTVATAVGVLLALSILALTIGLLRSDASRDLRTLNACGATRRIRRSITATTSGVLAAVGVGLGTVAAYSVLVVGYWPDSDRLAKIPVGNLAVLLIGLPVLASAMAWAVGGNERTAPAHAGD